MKSLSDYITYDDYYISRPYFIMLDCKWSPYTCYFSDLVRIILVLNPTLYIGNAEELLVLTASDMI